MLFIQEISIYYHKNVRYPNYAQTRNSIKFCEINPNPCKFYPKEINSDTMFNCEVLLQSIAFRQKPDKIEKYSERFSKYNDEIFTEGKRDAYYNLRHLINNIRISKNQEQYKIMFCDERCYFRPIKRYGHNEAYMNKYSPFSYTDRLYETAFNLNINEYGRIIYNERYVSDDTGIWYYGLHTYNIINCDKSNFRKKMFFCKNPDYEYKQLVNLR